MAAQNVCRYHKFGHCKFSETCRFLHFNERCENSTCEIRSCKLRHPRKCKWFRDYNRCKFGEWCSFDHVDTNANEDSIKEIFDKLEQLTKIILEKDEVINKLAEKIKKLEENYDNDDDEDVIENDVEETDVNTTFVNPYLKKRYPCEICDFQAKSNAGLQLHVKSKHTQPDLISEELSDKNESEIVNEITQNNTDLEMHSEKNNEDRETFDIKIEIFCLVDGEKDVLVTRQNLIEKLNDQKEVESVEKVYVDKTESFIDVDDLQWNSVDIFLKSKNNTKIWKDLKFRRQIFSKCYLWDTFEDYYGEKSRENIKRIKEEERASVMRSRGYMV